MRCDTALDSRTRLHLAKLVLCLAATGAGSHAHAAVACDDRFSISTVSRTFDGIGVEVVSMKSRTVTLETGTVGMWRPEEDDKAATTAALTLVHQKLPDTRIDICPLTEPDLPNTEKLWLKYIDETVAALGEGTVVSDLTGTSKSTLEGVHVLEWSSREARFTHTRAETGKTVVRFHLLATEATRGIRFVLSAPADKMDEAIADLRMFLNSAYRPEVLASP